MAGDVRELLKREVTPEAYRQVLQEWKTHSIAEDRRDVPGLISTLTTDCVYHLPQTGHRWEGHEGARRFYNELLTAFPDVHFELTDIVVGPQGVCEQATVTGTFARDWLNFTATGARVEFEVIIFFPWDPAHRKFTGERVYIEGAGFTRTERTK